MIGYACSSMILKPDTKVCSFNKCPKLSTIKFLFGPQTPVVIVNIRRPFLSRHFVTFCYMLLDIVGSRGKRDDSGLREGITGTSLSSVMSPNALSMQRRSRVIISMSSLMSGYENFVTPDQ